MSPEEKGTGEGEAGTGRLLHPTVSRLVEGGAPGGVVCNLFSNGGRHRWV